MDKIRFDQISLPDVLYKYRSWQHPDHKKILTNYEIYFSSPFELDEHHECLVEIDTDYITQDNLYKYFDNKTPLSQFSSKEQREEYIQKLIKEAPLHNPEYREEVAKDARKKLNDQVSIFCASEKRDNLNLWTTFGVDLEGFCVGFNTREMFINEEIFGSGGPVTYEHHKLKPFYLDACQRIVDMSKVIFNLDKKFKNENEYRLSKFFLQEKKIKLNPSAFKELILGPNIEEDDKMEILEVVQQTLPKINIFQAKFHEDLETFSFQTIHAER